MHKDGYRRRELISHFPEETTMMKRDDDYHYRKAEVHRK